MNINIIPMRNIISGSTLSTANSNRKGTIISTIPMRDNIRFNFDIFFFTLMPIRVKFCRFYLVRTTSPFGIGEADSMFATSPLQ